MEWKDQLVHFEDEDTDGFDEAHFNGELFGSHLFKLQQTGVKANRSNSQGSYAGNSMIGNSFTSSAEGKSASSSNLSDSSYEGGTEIADSAYRFEGGSSRNLKKPQLSKKAPPK